MMGYSFGRWVAGFIEHVLAESSQLPVITHLDVAILLRQPNNDRLRALGTPDALCSYLTHMFRPVLLEQAHGRNAEFQITGVSGEEEWIPGEHRFDPHRAEQSGKSGSGAQSRLQHVERGSDVLIAILGKVEEERGPREWQAMVARVGQTQFIVYAPTASEGSVGFAMREQVGNSGKQATASPTPKQPASDTHANLATTG